MTITHIHYGHASIVFFPLKLHNIFICSGRELAAIRCLVHLDMKSKMQKPSQHGYLLCHLHQKKNKRVKTLI
jgi:hypothetical protein